MNAFFNMKYNLKFCIAESAPFAVHLPFPLMDDILSKMVAKIQEVCVNAYIF